RLVFSPSWFVGIDNIFELVTVFVTLLIAIYSHKLYKFTKENSYRLFSYSFFLISISYLVKILMDISIYYPKMKIIRAGAFTFITQTFQRFEAYYAVGFFVERFLLLLGLLGIFFVLHKVKDKKVGFLLIYLAFVSALFGNYLFHIFHITTSLLLLYICYYYYKNYSKNRSKNSFLVASSFFLIFVSQIIFITLLIHPIMYVIGESVQLLGYLILLFTFISILKK
ncbi:MAG: hypothetical protein QXR60_01075, partial [Candidatus Nanoarchaeia archaeon]